MEKLTDPKTGAVIEFDEKAHRYFLNGEQMRGVTTIIGMTTGRGGQIKDLPQHVQGIINKAGNFGTLVHEVTHYRDIGKPAVAKKFLSKVTKEDREKVEVDAASWKRFLKDEGFEVVESERRVYSIKHRVAGTMDNVLREIETGHLWCADKKTGIIKPEAKLQMSAYSGMWKEMTDTHLHGGIVVKLNQGRTKRGYKVERYPKWSADYKVFLCKLTSLRWDMANGAY